MIDENELIRTIVVGSDWQEVLFTIIEEEGLDPLDIDIVKLANSFMLYLEKIKKFDFRIPARFILIAAILLRLKCEAILEEEVKEKEKEIQKLDLDVPLLTPPIMRKTTKKVTLDDLVKALAKAFELKEKKEIRLPRVTIEVEPVDIEERIKEIYEHIKRSGFIKFSELVPVWKRKEIVDTLIPLLYLASRGSIVCEQEEMFKEIFIKLK